MIRDLVGVVVVAVLYVAAARGGLSLEARGGVASSVWPPTGIALSALLLFGYRLWPGVACGALAANLSVGLPLVPALAIAAGNTLEAVCGAYLLCGAGFRPTLERLEDVVSLIVRAALLSTLTSATIGAATVWLAGLAPATAVPDVWGTWWVGDVVGDLVIAPALLTWGAYARAGGRYRHYRELLLLSAALLVGCDWIFGSTQPIPNGWLVFPFIVWAGLRCGQRGTTAVIALTAGAAIWHTMHGRGPFAGPLVHEELLQLQAFLGVISCTGMVLAAVLKERRSAEQARQDNELRFRALIDRGYDAIVLIDAEARIAYASPSVTRLHGFTLDVGFPVASLLHPDERDNLLQILDELRAHPGRVMRADFRVRHAQDAWRWVEAVGTNLFNDPRVRAVVVNYRDVTERRRAEEALAESHATLERRVLERTAELQSAYEALRNEMLTRAGAEGALRATEERMHLLLRNVRDYAICMLDPDGRVASWNAGAQQIKGYTAAEIIGRDYACFFSPAAVGAGAPKQALLRATRDGQYESEGWWVRKDGSRFWGTSFISALRDEHGGLRGFLEVTRDTTERKEAEQRLAELSTRLLKSQDEERRRIGRELHDSTAQSLAAAAMNLALMHQMRIPLPPRAERVLEEASALIDQCSREIRTISHLLHPPLLDEVGLPSAVRWYVDGFTKRSGIQVDVEIASEIGRLPQDVETALFRIVQECLTNVHRHAQSTSARVQIARTDGGVVLTVADRGRGMASEILHASADADAHIGVGISGMRERVRQLGGRLEITSTDNGTVVSAQLPSPADGNGHAATGDRWNT